MNNENSNRNIDIVLCIDGTGSMNNCIDNVKKIAKEFPYLVINEMKKVGIIASSIRVKIIVFRDYEFDADCMEIGEFHELPEDEDRFIEEINRIDAHGGGDEPENGLEALFYAMKSDFTRGRRDRQIIVLFTDTDALPLLERKNCQSYPSDMVDMNELIDLWYCNDDSVSLKNGLKRLVVFAPERTIYSDLSSNLDKYFYNEVDMNNGLIEVDFNFVIKVIAVSSI